MAWKYQVSTGLLMYDGELVAHGYSGQPQAKNDPSREREANVGPIPRGRWKISSPAFSNPKKGPVCLWLTPQPGTETYGRSGFMVHGDSKTEPGTASHGCIILPRAARQRIADSPDKDMEVIP